jgi:signal transduction histidine kinase
VLAELELLSERMAEGALRADVLRARQSLADLSVLVERLLILSVPHRTLHDTHEVVSLRDLLEDTFTQLDPKEQRRITISKTDALVSGDSVLLATLIANAFSNALKFGEHVNTTLTLTDDWAVLCISDDGPGIETAEQEHVFEPFFRSQTALRRRIPGHGLGLALVRHIAVTHGGSASFAPTTEAGASLQIRLPIRKAEALTQDQ